jgi:hypothetical protein
VLSGVGGGNPAGHPARSGPGFGLATADLNGDGTVDVASIGPCLLRTLTNAGDGRLDPGVRFPAGKSAIDVAAGNLGGDKLPELAELDGTNPEQLVVYLNSQT